MTFHTLYNPAPSEPCPTGTESMTRQEFAAECDINYIITRVGAGVAEPLRAPQPMYVDATQVPDTYEGMLDAVRDADARFAALPARLRDRFGNDPALMLSFLADPSNRDEAIKYGLLNATPDASAPARVRDQRARADEGSEASVANS